MGYDSRDTLVARLTLIRSAIDSARIGQAVTVDGVAVTRGNLMWLLQEERQILGRIEAIDRASSGGMANLVEFGR